MAPSITEQLLAPQQAATRLNVAVRSLETWRVHGTGPAYVKVGKLVRYRVADLDKWISERLVGAGTR